MLTTNAAQTSTLPVLTLPVLSDSFVHLVTLIHRITRQERSFEVITTTERFTDVMREINHQKLIRGLAHYEYFEALPIQCPLPF